MIKLTGLDYLSVDFEVARLTYIINLDASFDLGALTFVAFLHLLQPTLEPTEDLVYAFWCYGICLFLFLWLVC